MSSTYDVTHKKSTPPNQKIFFRVQTRRLATSFEPLNSSLPLSAPELRARKTMCDPVVLARESGCQSGVLLDFVFVATRATCLPQNAFSNCIYCRLHGNFHVEIIMNIIMTGAI